MKRKLHNNLNYGKLFMLLAMLLFAGICNAQNSTFSGKVTDEQGNAVPGASIKLKITGRSTTTDQNGEFVFTNLSAPKEMATVSFLGFITREIALFANLKAEIRMKTAVNTMDEVVVTGMFDKRNVLMPRSPLPT